MPVSPPVSPTPSPGPLALVTVTPSRSHLDPWHPDIECRTHDIERNIRYRRLRYRMLIDIDDFHIRYRLSISNVVDIEGHISRYRRSRKDQSISKFRIFRYRPKQFRYRITISYTISKAFLTIDIEGHYQAFLTIDIEGHYRGRYRIVRYNILLTHSLRSGSSLYPGGITPAPKGLSTTSPGFLHPLLAEFHSLIHRDLTRKLPSIAPHPHVDFEQAAPSSVVGS